MSDDSSDGELPSAANRRRPRIVSSSSESEDSDVPISRSKKFRKSAISSDSEGSSSGSSIGISRRRSAGHSRALDDSSDWESTSGDSDGRVGVSQVEKSPKSKSLMQGMPSPSQTGNVSDMSDGNSEKCPICLLTFSNQDIGTPESCEHLFCADCITEWSKNVNTCPVDRMTFSNIHVRRKIGGKVVKTVPVNPRISSDEDHIFEDTTFCEVCRMSNSEETMLLCDNCDLGFHMHCLNPPLHEVPENQWYCQVCAENQPRLFNLALEDMTQRIGAAIRRMSRRPNQPDENQPSTSGHTTNGPGASSSRAGTSRSAGPSSSTSRPEAATSSSRTRWATTRTRTTTRRRRRRRTTRNVVVEYEIREGEKFPIKTKKKAVKRRRRKVTRKAPRTAARRALVRSSVRTRLAEQLKSANGSGLVDPGPSHVHHRLAVPALSIYGNRNELDYFQESEEEEFESGFGRGGTAVAVAPRSLASAILDSQRQIRRKMISIPSPTYASSAPDLLSSILESQSLLHSKHSNAPKKNPPSKTANPLSVPTKPESALPEANKVDVRKEGSSVSVKETPGYPGAGRNSSGGGAWRSGQGGGGGGQGHRGGNRPYSGGEYSSFSGEGSASQGNRPFQSSSPWQNNNAPDHFQQRDRYDNYPDRSPMQRGNPNHNRGRGNQARYGSQMPPRSLPASPWQNQMFPDLSRSFPGRNSNYQPPDIPNPVDMTTSHDPGYNLEVHTDAYIDVHDAPHHGPPPSAGQNSLPQPPIIRFHKPPLSEDEKSDSSLPREADKYDPMEPTLDDSSSEEEKVPRPINVHQKLTIVSPPRKDTCIVADYVSGSDSPGMLKVTPTILDQAVKQVLQERQDLISSQKMNTEHDSGGESEGDCPNFSIYSATSMGIAQSRKGAIENNDILDSNQENEEDLVQEDDRDSIDENIKDDNPQVNMIPVPHLNKTETLAHTEEVSIDHEPGDQNETSIYNDELQSEVVGVDQEDKADQTDIEAEKLKKLFEGGDSSEEEKTDTVGEGQLEQDEKIQDETVNSLSPKQIKPDTTPIKKSPITIKLLPHRLGKKNTFSLYDKEDYEDIPSESEGQNISKPVISPAKVTQVREYDEEANNSSFDEEIKQTDTSDLLPTDVEKLTESISDAEDERSYTPCLDENKCNKSRDTTLDSEKETTGIGGLDTEMISDDEGNELFSDINNLKTDSDNTALELLVRDTELPQGEFEEGEIVEKRKQKVKEKVKALLSQPVISKPPEEEKKKKKKEKRTEKDVKDKGKSKKSNEDSFKKISKSGKERNYRERDDKNKSKNKDKEERREKDERREKEKRSSRSPDKEKKDKAKDKDKKRDKRKDIERYDVRNIISDKSRRVKDAFGRDTSRPRSRSADSQEGSPAKFKRSVSRKRSASRGRRSASRARRSNSKVPHRSLSRGRRSPSRKRRSISRGRRSVSRRRRSISPRFRRSQSPRFPRSMSPKHKAHSPKRPSPSPRGRSPIVRGKRSISPRIRRSKSPRIRRSTSRIRNKRAKRSPSMVRRRSSPGRLHRPISPRRRPLRRSKSRGRSVSPPINQSPKLVRKPRKPKRHRSVSSKRKMSKSPAKPKMKRKRSRSFSPGVVLSRSHSRSRERQRERERENVALRAEWGRAGPDKSPLYQDWSSASHSMSPAGSPGWTPPPQQSNLRVIVTNKDKSKKKDKKKKTSKKTKTIERNLQHQSKDTGPSKEVFTSGNNILVSVSFNKKQDSENGPAMPPPEEPPKKKKHKDTAVKAKKDKNKEKIKKKRMEKSKRSKDLENKKPVAIIDLDKSPFKEMTPSPKAIIVLSDSENGEKEEELMERQEMLRGELLQMEKRFPHSDDIFAESPPQSPNAYLTTAGPKTPPEPAVKFTISNKSNPQLRAVNPLHEEEDEIPVEDAAEGKETTDTVQRGPNTPPDPPHSPPSSPDAYDPFEPTKSGSNTPERASPPPSGVAEKHVEKRPEDLLQVPTMSLEAAQKSNLSADDVIQARPISPMEKVLALLKSTRNNPSPANSVQPLYSEQIFDHPKLTDAENQGLDSNPTVTVQSPERNGASVQGIPSTKTQTVYPAIVKPNSPKLIYSSVTPSVVTSTPGYLTAVPRIGVYSSSTPPSNQRIMLPSPTKSQPSKLFLSKPSPIKSTPIKPMPSKTIISKLPMPSIKPLPARGAKGNNGKNGNDIIELDMDMDSPYSPGSSDFGDLFEPPADNGKQSNNYSQNKPNSKFNTVFDSLFGGKSGKANKNSALSKVPVRQMKKTKGNKTQIGVRMDEDALKILDDVPSSAVEMQVKTKFLKKLNRQERVVEEVKLVLKPHYNKKHISKEDYKDILRRAVPKICHNRTGEINPAKIHALIEAYVRKFRKKAHQAK